MDAMAAVDGSDPLQVTAGAWSGIGKALADIRKVAPDVTRTEIFRRVENYKRHYPNAACTALALAKHWALCDKAPSGGNQGMLPIRERDEESAARAKEF